ncbi:MAG: glucokinase [Pseudohongiella sp.]|nr:glucokinase [Pseudohongiella sp.]MDP2128253.1 glucokinase [Pseudohongiella sp.]
MTSSILLADIGGTNVRFALSTENGAPLECVTAMRCADFERPIDAIRQYLAFIANSGAPLPGFFCMAVAAAVRGDLIRFTNNDWQFSQAELSQSLGMPITVLNDFEAQAWCLLDPNRLKLRWINKPATLASSAPGISSWPHALRTIAGPGTGFGAASLTAGGEVISAEPGHIAFSPLDETDLELLQQLWRWYPRVTVEHLISGPGIANIFCAVSCMAGNRLSPAEAPATADIVAMADSNRLAHQTLQLFSRWMGAICGDIALTKGSRGGFLLSGGLLAKLGKNFDEMAFMNAFTSKSAFSQWCEAIPVAYVLDEFPGLAGCAVHTYFMTGQRQNL